MRYTFDIQNDQVINENKAKYPTEDSRQFAFAFFAYKGSVVSPRIKKRVRICVCMQADASAVRTILLQVKNMLQFVYT